MQALIKEIAATLASSEAHARLALDAVLAALKARSHVTLRGFGRFARTPDGRITFKMSTRLRKKRGKAELWR